MSTKTLIIGGVIFAVLGIGGYFWYKDYKSGQLAKEQEELTQKYEDEKFMMDLKHDQEAREGDAKLKLIGAGYTAAQADSIIKTY